MSKRHEKPRQANPNRARSKNNPDGKRNDPKTDWSEYNKGRRSEGRRFVRWMRQIAEIAREILGIAPGTRDRRVSGHDRVRHQERSETLLRGSDQAL